MILGSLQHGKLGCRFIDHLGRAHKCALRVSIFSYLSLFAALDLFELGLCFLLRLLASSVIGGREISKSKFFNLQLKMETVSQQDDYNNNEYNQLEEGCSDDDIVAENAAHILTESAEPPFMGSGAEEHQGSGAFIPDNIQYEHPSQALIKTGSQISLIKSKTLTISRPILENHQQQQQQQNMHFMAANTLNPKRHNQRHHGKHGVSNTSKPSTQCREDSRQSKRMPSKENMILGGSPLHNKSQHESPVDSKHKRPVKQMKKDASIGRVSTKIGLKLKKQPPPLPKSFETSPLFDTNLTSQYFRIQPKSQKESQQNLFNLTMKMAQEAQQLKQKNSRARIGGPSPEKLKHAFLKEQMQTSLTKNSRVSVPREQFSVKFSTNKDMFAPFEIETVSDAFTTVELKKAAREIQNQKRRLRQQKVRAILGASVIYSGDISIAPLQLHDPQNVAENMEMQGYARACTPPSPAHHLQNNAQTANEDTLGRMSLGAPIRKTSTMVMNEKDCKQQISPRLAFLKQATEQDNSAHGGHKKISPVNSGKKNMSRPFRVGQASVEDRPRATPDSRRSYSIGSINSMDEQVRQHLKKSLEDHRQLLSQSSTVDLGHSISKSKQSLRIAEANKQKNLGDRDRKSSVNPSPMRKLNRQRTYGSTKLTIDREFDHQQKHSLPRDESGAFRGGVDAQIDEQTLYSRNSKVGTLSQKFNSESRDQKIFDVYMKAPYRLMDTSKQRRQQNRHIMKNLTISQSPSKERFAAFDGTLKVAEVPEPMMSKNRNSMSKGGKAMLQNNTGQFKSKGSILDKGSEVMEMNETTNSDFNNRKATTLKLRQQGSTQNQNMHKKRQASQKRNSQLEMTLANYRPKEHSPPRSPTYEKVKKQEQKEGMVVDSVSYLQQVFIQRKQEDKQQKTLKRNLRSNINTNNGSPSITISNISKQKSLRTEKKRGEQSQGEQSKITRVRNPSATVQPQVRKASAIRSSNGKNEQAATMPFTTRINKDQLNKQNSKLSNIKDSSGEPSQERRDGSNTRNKNDAWVEEQKANFEMTYLRPLKLKKTNDIVAKPQAKTIKSGRLVKLPIVTRNKEPILAKAGMESLQMHENRGGYSSIIHGKKVDQQQVPVDNVQDETIESQNSQRGDIINLQLGTVNGNMLGGQDSGEIRYKEDGQEEEEQEQDDQIDFGELINGAKTTTADMAKIQRKNTMKSSNDRKNSGVFDEEGKRRSVSRKPSPLYPKIYAQQPRPKGLGGRAQLPWGQRRPDQQTQPSRENRHSSSAQEEQGNYSTEITGTEINQLSNTDGKNRLIKQDSLRRNYHAAGLKTLQNSENKLFQAKLQKIAPVTTTHNRQRSENLFPHSLQTTAAFSPEMPSVLRKDTRPTFLGGNYKSKVKGVSEVGQYIKQGRLIKDVRREEMEEGYDVKSYYRTKMMMKQSMERAFTNQVQQYHHDFRNRNADAQKFQTLPALHSERDQGDLELPQITPNKTIDQQQQQIEQV